MISDKIYVTGIKSPSKHSTRWNSLMLPPSALRNMLISKQRITDAEFMSVAQGPAIVIHIFAVLQLHPSVHSHGKNCHRCRWVPTFSHRHTGSCSSSPVLSIHSGYKSFTRSNSAYNEIHHCVQSDFGLQTMQRNIECSLCRDKKQNKTLNQDSQYLSWDLNELFLHIPFITLPVEWTCSVTASLLVMPAILAELCWLHKISYALSSVTSCT
jgi:hypothetical protein